VVYDIGKVIFDFQQSER